MTSFSNELQMIAYLKKRREEVEKTLPNYLLSLEDVCNNKDCKDLSIEERERIEADIESFNKVVYGQFGVPYDSCKKSDNNAGIKLKTDDTDIQEIRMDAEPEGQGCEQHPKESGGE